MAWKLCSKEDVLSIHPFPPDELQDFWSDSVEELIKTHMGTPNLGESIVLVNETYDGDGTNVLIVRQPPILSVEAIRISGIATTAAEYVVYQNHVALTNQSFPEGLLNVQIDYTSGATIVSPSVRLTASAMIAAIVNYKQRYGADSTLKWATGDQQIGESTPNLNVGLTSHLTQIMKRMLRRERIRAS